MSLRLAALAAPLLMASSPPATQPTAPEPAPAVTRTYAAVPEAIRAALLAVFESRGLALDAEAEAAERVLVTTWAPFTRDDFGPSVATPPPEISRVYPFLQPVRLSTGRYRIRATIEPGEGGEIVTLNAEIEAPAFNRITYEHQEVSRTSNGVIEGHVLDELDGRLHGPSPPEPKPED
jgi:hypothetical protein